MSRSSENITLEQLAEHNTLDSLWIAVHGYEYDLTTFSLDHPGGIEALKSCAGTDGTESYEYAGHSKSNMAKMQQYRIGGLAGSPEYDSLTLNDTIPAKHERMKSTTSHPKRFSFPHWAKVAVTISAAWIVLALIYQRRDNVVDYVFPKLSGSQLQLRAASNQNVGQAFWAGIAVASSVSCVGFRYLYKLFLSSLDYENDVFSFPATIPRKAKR